jgi:site-specific recombinase XerD
LSTHEQGVVLAVSIRTGDQPVVRNVGKDTKTALSKVSQFRSEWKDGPRSSAKKLERLRAFFRFTQKRKWVTENPALDLKAPKITLCPTLPFGREAMVRILAAADQYKKES